MTDEQLSLDLAGDLAYGIDNDRLPAAYRTLYSDPDSYRAARAGSVFPDTPRGVTASFTGVSEARHAAVPEPRPEERKPSPDNSRDNQRS